ncbi:MAG: phenylalanine--tRNA ligase subunit alpha, partial [Myxococcota bacterium]|nr:phenylalanine--tRNA ligase subunit alpha [Myxococcota bacterium]
MGSLPDLDALEDSARSEIAAATTPQALLEVRASYLGKKGSLAEVLRSIGQLTSKERGPVGQRANQAKQSIEQWVAERRGALESAEIESQLAGQRLDVTLPGTGRRPGALHPVARVMRDVETFFRGRGFTIEDGPEVETEHNNFDALNMPDNHPARDMQDTFWVEGGHVLRTHTSPVQIRAMSEREPP